MKSRSLFLYSLLAALIVAIDQLSKSLIRTYLAEGQSVSVIGDFLYFNFVYNTGGAMGTRLGPSWVYLGLTVIALVVIIRYFLTVEANPTVKIGLAMIFGGAIGNLIDRVIYGKVVDFIDMDIPDVPFLNIYRWFTYNIADAAITIGLLVFAVSLMLRKKDNIPVEENESSGENLNYDSGRP